MGRNANGAQKPTVAGGRSSRSGARPGTPAGDDGRDDPRGGEGTRGAAERTAVSNALSQGWPAALMAIARARGELVDLGARGDDLAAAAAALLEGISSAHYAPYSSGPKIDPNTDVTTLPRHKV